MIFLNVVKIFLNVYSDIYLRSLEKSKIVYNLNLKITLVIYFVTKAYARRGIRNVLARDTRLKTFL